MILFDTDSNCTINPGMVRNPPPEPPSWLFRLARSALVIGLPLLVFGGYFYWAADGAPPVKGIRDAARAFWGCVTIVGAVAVGVSLLIAGSPKKR
jgi:hypothetical protein